MPNTFTQLYIHVVFTVQGRQNLLPESHREEIQKYIGGIIRNKGNKLFAISCMTDHVHVLIGLRPSCSVADAVKDIKSNASRFINSKQWIKGEFRWQEGYGAFSNSHS